MNNSTFLSNVKTALALTFAFAVFGVVTTSTLMVTLGWNWLTVPVYTFFVLFGILVTISALIKLHRAYTEYDTSCTESHTRRMLYMSFTIFTSLMTWFIIYAIDYSEVHDNAMLFLVFTLGFVACMYFSEWFITENAKTIN